MHIPLDTLESPTPEVGKGCAFSIPNPTPQPGILENLVGITNSHTSTSSPISSGLKRKWSKISITLFKHLVNPLDDLSDVSPDSTDVALDPNLYELFGKLKSKVVRLDLLGAYTMIFPSLLNSEK